MEGLPTLPFEPRHDFIGRGTDHREAEDAIVAVTDESLHEPFLWSVVCAPSTESIDSLATRDDDLPLRLWSACARSRPE
jgi:hypothetical protein